MAIDFSLSPELEELRGRIRDFIDTEVKPVEARIESEKLDETDRKGYIAALVGMRKKAFAEGLWLPHMPEDWGGMSLDPDLGPVGIAPSGRVAPAQGQRQPATFARRVGRPIRAAR